MAPPASKLDPAADAAALLRRLGFVALLIGIPVGAFAGPGAVLVAAALGAALLALAAVLDRQGRALGETLAGLACSTAALALLVLAAWAGLSLLWTPSGRPAVAALGGVGAVFAGGLIAFLALPDRMRSANLYLLPIGTALSALVGLALAVGAGPGDTELARRAARGLTATVLFAWPAIAWLRSRGRDMEAAALALLVLGASTVVAGPVPGAAFAAGALAYGVTLLPGRAGRLVLGLGLAALVLAAPLAVAFAPAAGFAGWRTLLLAAPVRLLTGHGFGALPGYVAAGLPAGTLGAVWYELGLVGAAALAAFAFAAAADPPSGHPALPPSAAAALGSAAFLALASPGQGAAWRFAVLAAVGLAFIAAERGQYRTRRPRALPFRRAREA